MRQFFEKYQHLFLLLYFPFYLACFRALELMKPDKIHIINCGVDQFIPFLEIFIIPYLMWFFYIGAAGFYFLFAERTSFCRMMYFGMIGMTLFVLISWLYPNGLTLRPEVFPRENIFTDLVRWIYSMDTATNVLPSIHVYNSVGICVALRFSEKLKDNKPLQTASLIITVLIILSTMFIKQHSVVDVISGLALAWCSYELVYDNALEKIAGYVEILREMRYRRRRVPRWMSK